MPAAHLPEILDPASYRRVPWKNGGGVTLDIAGAHRPGFDPAGWDGMIWRLGRTRIETPGPFSEPSRLRSPAGCRRWLRSGAACPAGRPPLDVRQPFHAVRFAGDWPIDSELTAGPVGVLNLLADRTAMAIALSFVAAPAAATLEAARSIVLALAPTRVRLDGVPVSLTQDGAFSIAGGGALAVEEGLVAIAALTPVAAPSS